MFTMIPAMPSSALLPLIIFGGPVEAPIPVPPTVAMFQERDLDKDGMLSRQEYVKPNLGSKWEKAAKREAVSYDLDGDGMLSRIEFARTPPGKADPTTMFELLDANADKMLSQEEFAERHAPGYEEAVTLEFLHFDADGSGRVELDEFHGRGKVKAGQFVERFSQLDTDGDHRISRTEYVKPSIGGEWEEAAKKESVRFDIDDDGFLKAAEFARTPRAEASDVMRFALGDTNQDGALAPEEFSKLRPSGYDEAVMLEFHHFDVDGSGGVALEEFLTRGHVVAAEFVKRYAGRDEDGDGRLSRKEYVRPNIGSKWEEAAKKEAVLYDLDGDGFLTAAEFACTPPAEASQAMKYALGDVNRDGALTREELSGINPQADPAVVGAQFLRYDADGDRRIVAAEWNRQGWKEEPIFDPVIERVDRAMVRFKRLFEKRDRDGDGALELDERAGEEIETAFPNLVGARRSSWDRDGDGAVTKEEARRLLEVAWGVRRLSGESYRRPTGHVFNWDSIRKLDNNGDADLSREEFVEGHWARREQNTAIFEKIDVNDDDNATFAELAAVPHFAYDALWGFSLYDSNADQRLNQAELDATPREWEKKMTPYLIAAFDDDGDGRLNLREFRLTPLANPYADWYSLRPDANHDGRLSWEEFYDEDPLEMIALYREYFQRFDRDDDGSLAPDEFEFRIDLEKIPEEVAFAVQDHDGNGQITFEEAFDEPKPKGDDRQQAEAYQMRLIRAEESFLTGDTDGDGAISLAEFRKARKNPATAATLGPAPATSGPESDEGISWPIVGFLALDALVLLGVGVWFLRGTRSRS